MSGWRIYEATAQGLELRSTDARFALTLRQNGVWRYFLTLGPTGTAPEDCPIALDLKVGKKVWVERAEVVTMRDVRVIKAVLVSLGFTHDLTSTAIGKLHVTAARKLSAEGRFYQETKPDPPLPNGGLRLLHTLNGSWEGDRMRSDKTMLEMIHEGYITVELTERGRAVVEESVRSRKPAPLPEPPRLAAVYPLGTHACDACGQQTRNTTAGCDHCDWEDK